MGTRLYSHRIYFMQAGFDYTSTSKPSMNALTKSAAFWMAPGSVVDLDVCSGRTQKQSTCMPIDSMEVGKGRHCGREVGKRSTGIKAHF